MKKTIILLTLLFFGIKSGYSKTSLNSTIYLNSCSTESVNLGGYAADFNNSNNLFSNYLFIFSVGNGWTTSPGVHSYQIGYNLLFTTIGIWTIPFTPASPNNVPDNVTVGVHRINNDGSTTFVSFLEYDFARKAFSSRSAIIGDKEVCLNVDKVYSLSNLQPNVTVQWSLLNSSSGVLTNLPDNRVSLKMTSNVQTEIMATISNSCNQVVTKKMVINAGPPTFNNITNYTGTVISSGYGTCDDINLAVNFNSTILEYQWEKVTQDVSANIDMTNNSNSNVLSIYPNCNKEFVFKIRARNSCGWSPWKELSYQITNCTTDCAASVTGISGDNFILYAIPVTNGMLNVDVQPNAPWFLNTGSGSQLGTGIDNNGLIYPIRVNVTIYNNSGIVVSSFSNTMIPAQLNISNLPSGNYLVVFTYNRQSESHTIIIN